MIKYTMLRRNALVKWVKDNNRKAAALNLWYANHPQPNQPPSRCNTNTCPHYGVSCWGE